MNFQLANLSADLRRISNWILEGKRDFVKEYITTIEGKYDIDSPVGPYEDIWKEIELIKLGKGGRISLADRAGTLSSILLQESLKK